MLTVARRTEKPSRSVNELLALSRHSFAGSSSSRQHPVASPSVPPAIREILQIPETPSPRPRRPIRQRVDNNGRRLPAGPAPPPSWVTPRPGDADAAEYLSRSLRVRYPALRESTLPGAPIPQRGSLIDITLKHLAVAWESHRVYDQFHLYFIPNHLKPALIHYLGIASDDGMSLSDLKLILLPPKDVYSDEEISLQAQSMSEMTCLDLTASIGRSLSVKDVSNLLFSKAEQESSIEIQDSWDAVDVSSSPPKALLPHLTHLSLAVDHRGVRDVSWKQLLSLTSKLPTITHLSLAYWPDPCLTPRARFSTVSSPQGANIPYGGTNYYSHSIDQDWSEALLVLRILSSNLYKLEFLDLTGCASWFKALHLQEEHDFVDWVGSWGKVMLLRLNIGWKAGPDALVSEQAAYAEAMETAAAVEKHIRAMRAGQGRFITVERDRLEF